MSEFTIASLSVKEVRRETILAMRKTVFLALCLQPPSNKGLCFRLMLKMQLPQIQKQTKQGRSQKVALRPVADLAEASPSVPCVTSQRGRRPACECCSTLKKARA